MCSFFFFLEGGGGGEGDEIRKWKVNLTRRIAACTRASVTEINFVDMNKYIS